ncbi:hypothetical protein ACLHWY_10445 [Priestia aryabhattai]|uniref:hypothetical protein n=1 Tax=Priestia TaxID=2800373 RepID=UPI003983309C
MVKQIKVLCIKTSFNIDYRDKIDFLCVKIYDGQINFDDILVEDESKEWCLVGQTADEAVRLGIQQCSNGKWDDWFTEHFTCYVN